MRGHNFYVILAETAKLRVSEICLICCVIKISPDYLFYQKHKLRVKTLLKTCKSKCDYCKSVFEEIKGSWMKGFHLLLDFDNDDSDYHYFFFYDAKMSILWKEMARNVIYVKQ